MILDPAPSGEEFCAVEYVDVLEAATPLYEAIEALPLHRRRRHVELAAEALLLYLDCDKRARALQYLSTLRSSLN